MRDGPNAMIDSYLVQRLQKPSKGTILGRDNPFAFGGGMRNGGLSDDAMDLLRDIFSFDYMGSAEFEFGAVPKALQTIAQNVDDYAKGTISVALRDVASDSRDTTPKTVGDVRAVFVICRKGDVDEVFKRIMRWAGVRYGENLKESTHLARSLRPFDDYDEHTQGWLELDNGFMFFTDEEMWLKTCKLFGIGGSE